jgi:hypothetical protein
MNADYDARVPNDYMAFKQLMYSRRRAECEHARWLADERGCAGPALAQRPLEDADARRHGLSAATSGEEAYRRRVAMSAPAPPADSPSTVADFAARQSAAAAIAARLAPTRTGASARDANGAHTPRADAPHWRR